MSGRKLGARNRKTVIIAQVFDRLERAREIDPEKWVRALDAIALDEKRDDYVRLAAIDKLLRFKYGAPTARIEATHEAGQSWEAVLTRIVQSPEVRRSVEELEAWRERRRLGAITTSIVEGS